MVGGCVSSNCKCRELFDLAVSCGPFQHLKQISRTQFDLKTCSMYILHSWLALIDLEAILTLVLNHYIYVPPGPFLTRPHNTGHIIHVNIHLRPRALISQCIT